MPQKTVHASRKVQIVSPESQRAIDLAWALKRSSRLLAEQGKEVFASGNKKIGSSIKAAARAQNSAAMKKISLARSFLYNDNPGLNRRTGERRKGKETGTVMQGFKVFGYKPVRNGRRVLLESPRYYDGRSKERRKRK